MYPEFGAEALVLPPFVFGQIGERGANLSGGQRQRISLARALYSDRDIYILDDPLSALDPRVANHIFHNAIKKQLRNKTIIFVTHQLQVSLAGTGAVLCCHGDNLCVGAQYLVDCDDVILMKEGSIVEQGHHDNLMKLNGDYAAMFNHFQLGDSPYIEVQSRLSVHLSFCLSL